MLDKIKDAIAKARDDGRDVPPVIEELFMLIGTEIDASAAPAKQSASTVDSKPAEAPAAETATPAATSSTTKLADLASPPVAKAAAPVPDDKPADAPATKD